MADCDHAFLIIRDLGDLGGMAYNHDHSLHIELVLIASVARFGALISRDA